MLQVSVVTTPRFSVFLKLGLLVLSALLALIPASSLGRSQQTIGKVRFSWDPNPEPIVTGYKVHWGSQPGIYTNTLDVGNVTEVVIQDFAEGAGYYAAITAYSDTGDESDYSDEIQLVWTKEAALQANGRTDFQINSLTMGTGGQLTLQLSAGSIPTSVEVQASNDLTNWTVIGVATPLEGVINITDPEAADHNLRFYRIDDGR